MLQALRGNLQRQAVSKVKTMLPPIGGLNSIDPLSNMPPTDAVIMDNMFPDINSVRLRRGYTSFATGIAGDIETLFTYHALNGSEKLIAASANNFWNVTAGGGGWSPMPFAGTVTSTRWQYINFSNAAGLFILAVNGSDLPVQYNGTGWTANPLAGSIPSSAATVKNIFQHKERVWLVEKNTLNLWYLASQAISGTATKFPLIGVFNKGGQIVAGGTFSFDAGAGIDDYLVAVTDNGEAAVYTGTNPASDFLLRGVYEVGQPVGARCLVKVAGDLIIITTKGAVPLSQMVVNDRAKADQLAITAKIAPAFNEAIRNYGSNFGWEGMVYPKGGWVLFNVPIVQNSTQRQYVQNIITGAWCRFTNWNANCWTLFNDELYFGGINGIVYKADNGRLDNGGNIEFELKTSFNYCGSPGRNKFYSAMRTLLKTSGPIDIIGGINVDFNNTIPSGELSPVVGDACIWGTGLWGTNTWGGAGFIIHDWLTVGQIGTCVAIRLRGAANGVSVECNGFDVLYQEVAGAIY